MKETDEGIFLHRTPFSDSSIIVSFYTKSSGFRKFVFRGGKKKAHQLYPLSVSELSFYGRQGSELLNLTGADPAAGHDFQFDPLKSTIAFFLAETIRKCVAENDYDATTYRFLRNEVDRLNTADNCALFPLEFMVAFAEVLGFQPLVSDERMIFDLDEGVIGSGASRANRTTEGEHVQLISRLVSGEKLSGRIVRSIRDKALETMMEYYKIHIPRLREFETYEIVKEILMA